MNTKALRQKILDLAIRGKLVPQDPNDEPASVLLERIRAEKQKMVKEGKLKAKDIKTDSVIYKGEDNLHYEKFADGTVKCIEDEIPFDIPDSWAWTRLGNVATIKGGKRIPKGYTCFAEKTRHAYIRVTNMKNQTILLNDIKYISDDVYEMIKSYTISKNDLYITIAGTIGVVGEVPIEMDEMNLTENAAKISCLGINKCFLLLILQTEFVQKQFRHKTYQVAMPKLGLERIELTLIPVCPLSESDSIYTRYSEILSVLKSIETDKADLEKIIIDAKSRILDLAIRGKLVPQDENDEPASVLLERIKAEKEELIKQCKIKREKTESAIFKGEDNSYYRQSLGSSEKIDDWVLGELPHSWCVCCLGEICDYGNCVNVDTADICDDEWILDLEDIEKDTGTVLKKVTKKERNSISTKHRFYKGQVLYSKLRPYLNKVVLADSDGYCTSEILPLAFSDIILPSFARYYLMTPTFLSYTDKCSFGVKMPRLSTDDGKRAVFLIPPLKEQCRIVEAIEKYFAYLDNIAQALA